MTITHIHWVRSGSAGDDLALAYAGRELARYLGKLTGTRPAVRAAGRVNAQPGTAWLGICDRLPAPPTGALSPAPWDDGYAIWAEGGALYIAGRNARSVLFGVYAFLETQGVRFVRPGPAGEVIPAIADVTLPSTPIVEMAHYRHRGVCIEGATSLDHALGMVDWCAKRRMNTVFLQFIHSGYFYNQWYERKYNPKHAGAALTEAEALQYDDQLIAAMQRRGLIFHRVGHGWTSAAFGMPRSGWVTETAPVPPDAVRWLAEVKGERKLFADIPINTELCYSFQPAFDAFVETIVRYCEAHPELDVVHVWLSDAFNNKCECADCRPLTIADWYARIINALSEALHRRTPGTRFVFLAYFELWWAPEQVQIDDRHGNAILMFAPITRCFGHALGDPACDDGQEWPAPAAEPARDVAPDQRVLPPHPARLAAGVRRRQLQLRLPPDVGDLAAVDRHAPCARVLRGFGATEDDGAGWHCQLPVVPGLLPIRAGDGDPGRGAVEPEPAAGSRSVRPTSRPPSGRMPLSPTTICGKPRHSWARAIRTAARCRSPMRPRRRWPRARPSWRPA